MTSATRTVIDSRTTGPVGPADGVFYVGRPDWLTDGLLAGLQAEARSQRAAAEKIRTQHFGDLGPVAEALSRSVEVAAFLARFAPPVRFSGRGNYRYYDIPHSHVEPHVDTDDFAANLIVMLSHEYGRERRSALMLYPHGPDPIVLQLEPGEVVLFHASEVIHARSPISADNEESAVNLGLGFTPTGEPRTYDYWRPPGYQPPADHPHPHPPGFHHDDDEQVPCA
jgi:hypothetical protein